MENTPITTKSEQDQEPARVPNAALTEEERAKKRELKKQQKTERYDAKRAFQRQKEKEKGKKKPRSSLEHITRFNYDQEGDAQNLSKEEK